MKNRRKHLSDSPRVDGNGHLASAQMMWETDYQTSFLQIPSQENTLTVCNDSYSVTGNSSEANVALPFGAIQVFK
jgi:hypothetical protein